MKNNHAVLTHLVEQFPETFVLEKYLPHRPLKVGIAADLKARCPELTRYTLGKVLGVYTARVMYLKGMVAGTARIDLDGNPAGEVSAQDAEHAAARLAGILAARIAERAEAMAAKVATHRSSAPTVLAPQGARSPTPLKLLQMPAKVLPLKERPVLRLPAFRTAAQ
jgi:ProP effector